MSIEDEALKVLKSVKQMGESVEEFIGKMVNELKKDEEKDDTILITVEYLKIGRKFKYKDLIYTKTNNTKNCIISANNIIKGYECAKLNESDIGIVIFGGDITVEVIDE